MNLTERARAEGVESLKREDLLKLLQEEHNFDLGSRYQHKDELVSMARGVLDQAPAPKKVARNKGGVSYRADPYAYTHLKLVGRVWDGKRVKIVLHRSDPADKYVDTSVNDNVMTIPFEVESDVPYPVYVALRSAKKVRGESKSRRTEDGKMFMEQVIRKSPTYNVSYLGETEGTEHLPESLEHLLTAMWAKDQFKALTTKQIRTYLLTGYEVQTKPQTEVEELRQMLAERVNLSYEEAA